MLFVCTLVLYRGHLKEIQQDNSSGNRTKPPFGLVLSHKLNNLIVSDYRNYRDKSSHACSVIKILVQRRRGNSFNVEGETTSLTLSELTSLLTDTVMKHVAATIKPEYVSSFSDYTGRSRLLTFAVLL